MKSLRGRAGIHFLGCVLVLVAALIWLPACSDSSNHQEFKVLRIAHAGGGYKQKSYTNSYDALDFNYQKGFRYFEIDFSYTSDSHLVCIHDWEHSFKRSFGFDTKEKPTLKTFEFLVNNAAEFRKCTLTGLAKWMKAHPDAFLVTDVKEDNLDALSLIRKQIPSARERVIPQVYRPENYQKIKAMGYQQLIWTLYRYPGSPEKVMKWVKTFSGPFVITMPKHRAETNLPIELGKLKVATYVHTVNKPAEADKFFHKYGITEIYTDYMDP